METLARQFKGVPFRLQVNAVFLYLLALLRNANRDVSNLGNEGRKLAFEMGPQVLHNDIGRVAFKRDV